jgi:hypothetical protein
VDLAAKWDERWTEIGVSRDNATQMEETPRAQLQMRQLVSELATDDRPVAVVVREGAELLE